MRRISRTYLLLQQLYYLIRTLSAVQIIVVAEKSIIVEPDKALEDMMSIYFTFNIAYPKPLYPLWFLYNTTFLVLRMTRLNPTQ